MAGIEIVNHKGKRVVTIDVSHSKPDVSLDLIPKAHTHIAEAGPKGALVLTDVTDTFYNKAVSAAIKDFVSNNTPYIKASAVVGAKGVRGVLLQTAIVVSRRDIKAFDDRAAALDWLASI